MTGLEALVGAWHAFLHEPEPAATIARFRILFGLLVLANAFVFARQAPLWIGEQGFLPRHRFLQAFGHTRFTLFAWLPASTGWMSAVLGLHFLAGLTLTLGLATPVSAAVVFVTLASLQHRNPLVLHGGDHVLRIMSLLLVFSRAGETWSLDAWLATGSLSPVSEGSAWCTRLMQLQVSILYLKAVVAKLEGRSWRDGTAVYYAATAEAYRRAPLPRFARSLAASRLMTWGTLAVELALGTLIWLPAARHPVLGAGVALHLVMEAFLNLQLFGATMIVCLTLFL